MSVIIAMSDTAKKYGLLVLGAAVGLSGVVVVFIWLDDVLIRSVGILMCLCGAYLVTASKKIGYAPSSVNGNGYSVSIPNSPSRMVWIIGATSLVASAVSFAFMYKDALDGYHQVWPVYAFAISMTVLALVASYIVGVLVRKMFSH